MAVKSEKQPLEDYLTELFAFCLAEDEDLLRDFLEAFSIYDRKFESARVTTQLELTRIKDHHSDSRPDMALFLDDNGLIFFENKVNSGEGFNQLGRYADHLSASSRKHKCLVYLTKYYDDKALPAPPQQYGIRFIQLRWFQVFQFLRKYKSTSIIIRELLVFMKQNQLAMSNQFSPSDILAMNQFSNIRAIMDECMGGEVYNRFEAVNNGISKYSVLSTQLVKHDRYIYWANHQDEVWVGFGFWMNSNNEKMYPDVAMTIECYKNASKRDEIVSMFRKIAADEAWVCRNFNDPSGWPSINFEKSLQDFLSAENHVKEIQQFFLECFSRLEEIFREYPELPRR